MLTGIPCGAATLHPPVASHIQMHPTIATARWAYRTAPTFWKRYSEDRKREVRRAPARPNPARVARHRFACRLARPQHRAVEGGWHDDPDRSRFQHARRPQLRSADPRDQAPRRAGAPSRRTAEDRSDAALARPLRPFRYADSASAGKRGTRRWSPRRRRPTSCGSIDTAPCTRLDGARRAQVGPAAIRAFQVNHWGARMRNDTYRGYNGVHHRSGPPPHSLRRRHGRDHGISRGADLAALRSGHHAGRAYDPGFTTTARPSRRGRWRRTPGPSSSCRCTIRHSRSAASHTWNRSRALRRGGEPIGPRRARRHRAGVSDRLTWRRTSMRRLWQHPVCRTIVPSTRCANSASPLPSQSPRFSH